MHTYYMQLALKEAKKALKIHEVPVGAVIVDSITNQIVAKAYNKVIKNNNPTHHAEILALTKAAKVINNYRLCNLDIYVTLEPCPMCAGALIHSRIKTVFFGAVDSKGGALVSNAQLFAHKYSYNHRPAYEGHILEEECAKLLKNFFQSLRNKKLT